MGLTRVELQKQWKQSTTNNDLKKAIREFGPRVAFGMFREFVNEVRNDFRPEVDELVDEWQISVTALRANLSHHKISIQGPSAQLSEWVRRSYAEGQSREWCMANFRVGKLVVDNILGKHDPAKPAIHITKSDLRGWLLEGKSLDDIATDVGVSKFRLVTYLKTHQLEYSYDLIRDDVSEMCRAGYRVSEIEQRLGVTSATIKKYMTLWGIGYTAEQLAVFDQIDSERRALASVKGSAAAVLAKQARMEALKDRVTSSIERGTSIKQTAVDCGISQGTVISALKYANTDWETKAQRAERLSRESMSKWLSLPRDGYDYSLVTYDDWAAGKIPIGCATHGTFYQSWSNHFSLGAGCPKCGLTGQPSKPENEIYQFVQSLGVDVVQSDRTVLGGKEIDIWIPSHRVGIEHNGLYWHSSGDINDLRRTRHLYKTEKCRNQGINLLHIFGNEWNDPIKQQIWKSVIKVKLGMASTKIPARQTTVTTINHQQASEFLESCHLQGKIGGSNLALIHNNQVVAVLVYGKSRFEKNAVEILRMCTALDTVVVGGMSKLISCLTKRVDGPIISYANKRWSAGNVYQQTGFELVNHTPPNYWYVKDGIRLLSRHQCQKHKLHNLLGSSYDPSMTEIQNMLSNKYRILYDCGNIKFRLRQH
jgi:hypothetical protein